MENDTKNNHENGRKSKVTVATEINKINGSVGTATTVGAALDYSKLSHAQLLEVIAERDAAIAEKDAAIAEKDAEIFHLSYDDMINKFGGIPDMPVNPGRKPHEHKGRTKFTINDNFVTADDLKFKFISKEKLTGYTLKSFIEVVPMEENPKDKNGPKILAYHNEASVAEYVKGVVLMCMKSLGIFETGRLYTEMSLFSLRPDLLLLMNKKGIILIIEVKMPGEALFTSEGIAKQVADYLLLQYRLGNTTPFVLLSSYREACLCHLKPDCLQTTDTTKGDGDMDEYREIVAEAARRLKVYADFDLGEESVANENGKPKTYSPSSPTFEKQEDFPPSLVPTTQRSKRRRVTSCERPEIKHINPEVVYSRPFDLSNMVHGVSMAIVCGLVALEGVASKPTKSKYWPTQGSSVNGLHPLVENGSLRWAQVRKMAIDYMYPTHMAIEGQGCKYLLLREIGQGQSGKVFLAVDCDGRACALKFFLNHAVEQAFSPDQRKADHLAWFREAAKVAKEECDRWKMLQSVYSDYVESFVLNDLPVLKMPVFVPVPPKDRSEVLHSVQAMLRNFFNKGYKYKEMRWQHVGCRRKENDEFELALLDLGSLDLSSNVNDSVIDNQITDLLNRIDTEPPSRAVQTLLPNLP